MYHCKQCRADAIGTLENDESIKFRNFSSKDGVKEEESALRFAVASKSGMLVDKHFGHVTEFYIYDYKEGIVSLVERRSVEKYCQGSEECDERDDKISKILRSIEDCSGVLTLRIGDAPANRLKDKGIKVFVTYERIEKAIKVAAEEIIKNKEDNKLVYIKEEEIIW